MLMAASAAEDLLFGVWNQLRTTAGHGESLPSSKAGGTNGEPAVVRRVPPW